MRKRKLVMAGCVMALTLAMMTGCGNSNAGATANTDTAQTAENGEGFPGGKPGQMPQDDGSKMVQVTKVDGNTITATVGEDMFSGKFSGNGETPPERPDGNSDGSSDGSSKDRPAPPDKNSDGDSGDRPALPDKNSDGSSSEKDGQRPERPDGEMPFTATDETLTFTITSDTKIMTGGKDGSAEGTVDDIKENSILRVSVNDNNEAQTIMIMGGK